MFDHIFLWLVLLLPPFFVLELGGCKTFTLQTFDTGEACCMRHKPSSIYLQSNCLFIYGTDTIETHAQLYFSQLQRFLASAGLQAPPWLAQQLKAWTARLLGAATADLLTACV